MRRLFISTTALFIVLMSFVKPILAVAPVIGSIEDPYITKTYFQANTSVFTQNINTLNTTVSSLQGTVSKNNSNLVAQIDALKAQIASLQQQVNNLSQGTDAVLSTPYTFGAILGYGYPLRVNPSETASSVASMPYYSGVDILGVTASNWYQVKYYNNIGFIPSDVLKILK